MGYDVTGLSNYTRENADDIKTAQILGADTLQKTNITVQAGIKNADKLMQYSGSAPFQDGTGCSFNASGTSDFTDKTITVVELKVQDTFCPRDLEKKFLNTKLKAGSNYEELAFEELIVGNKVKHIQKNVEQMIWQGDTSNAADPNLKLVDGLLKTIDAGSPVLATAQSSVTQGNVIAIFDDIYTKIPEELLNGEEEMIAETGWGVFRKLILALKDANNFHFDAGNASKTGMIEMPGTGLKVKALNGLNNITTSIDSFDDRIVCTYEENLIVGVDLEGEEDNFEIWFSKDDQDVKMSSRSKLGTQVYFIQNIVTYKNS
jgi:hypothetical protein